MAPQLALRTAGGRVPNGRVWLLLGNAGGSNVTRNTSLGFGIYVRGLGNQ